MWQGIVSSVSEQDFTALLFDLDQPGPIQCGDIPLSAITLDEVHLVKPGAVFTWSVETQKFCFTDVKFNEDEFARRLTLREESHIVQEPHE